MIIYSLSFVYLIFLSNIYKSFSKEIINFFYVIFCVYLVFLIGFRFDVGGDYDSYFKFFYVLKTRNSFESSVLTSGGDLLYNLINYYLAKVGFNYGSVNFVCAVIFIFCLYKFSTKQKNPILTMLIAFPYLVLVVSMGYTRQACAIGLFLYALNFLIERKILYTILILILASLFHKTAMILIPIVFLSINYQRTKIFFWTVFLFIFLFFILFYKDIFGYTSNYAITPIMESPGVFYRASINLICAIIFAIFFRHLFKKSPIIYNVYFYLSLASILLFVLQFYTSTLADRLGLYLISLQLYVFSSLGYLFKRTIITKIINSCVKLFYFVLLLFWLLYANHSYLWKPYKSLLFKDNLKEYYDRIIYRESINNEYYF